MSCARPIPVPLSVSFQPAIQDDPRCNRYGDVTIDGNASAVLGNVYYVLPLHAYAIPWRTVRRLGLYSCQTERLRHRLWAIPFLFSLRRETIVRRSLNNSERCLYIQLSILGRLKLIFGYCYEAQGDLRLYRPRLKFIVSPESDLFKACELGDISSLRSLMCRAAARPNDVTDTNHSALYFAIDNNHEQIVEELLLNGADVNQYVGENGTSPLAWALCKRNSRIVRSLIRHGAELDAINNDGWSLLQYLWDNKGEQQASCVDFLQLLQTSDPDITEFIRQTHVDADGFSLLSRVACLGTSDDMNFLLKQGADVYWKSEFDWNALFEAAHYGNMDIVQTLLPYFPDFREMRDVRGWTLLHATAEEGLHEMTRFLLQQGMDWQAQSWPYYTALPGCLIGRACTPADAARAEAKERETAYLNTVREVCDIS